jgi:hypothetical protein
MLSFHGIFKACRSGLAPAACRGAGLYRASRDGTRKRFPPIRVTIPWRKRNPRGVRSSFALASLALRSWAPSPRPSHDGAAPPPLRAPPLPGSPSFAARCSLTQSCIADRDIISVWHPRSIACRSASTRSAQPGTPSSPAALGTHSPRSSSNSLARRPAAPAVTCLSFSASQPMTSRRTSPTWVTAIAPVKESFNKGFRISGAA